MRSVCAFLLLCMCCASARAEAMLSSYYAAHGNTVAHRWWPKGTPLLLRNPRTGRQAMGVVRDRGPFIRGRSLDVSTSLARTLGFVRTGVTRLDVRRLR